MSNILFNEEAIDFQTDTAIVEQLTVYTRILADRNKYLESGLNGKEIRQKISDIIYDRFGIRIKIQFSLYRTFDSFYIIDPLPAPVNFNNFFHDRDLLFMTKEKEKLEKSLFNYLTTHTYEIDEKNAKISGLGNKTVGIIYITPWHLFYNVRTGEQHKMFKPIPPEETTAFILHAVGLMFSYLKNVMLTLRRNNLTRDSFKKFMNKSKTGKLTKKDLRPYLKNPSVLNTNKNDKKQALSIIIDLMGRYVEEVDRVNNSLAIGDLEADQFAMRIGVSEKHLVNYKKRINNISTDMSEHKIRNVWSERNLKIINYNQNSIVINILMSVVIIVAVELFIGGILMFDLVAIITSILIHTFYNTIYGFLTKDNNYASAKERIRRMRSELVLSLKEHKKELTKEERQSFLERIAWLEEQMKWKPTKLSENPLLVQIYQILTTKGRATIRGEQLYKLIEETNASDLELSILKLKNMIE